MTIGKGKRPSAPKRDFMEVAGSVVEHAIGGQVARELAIPNSELEQLLFASRRQEFWVAAKELLPELLN